MNKICGYSCEHNKGGVCQITRCIKMPLFTTTTYEPLRQQISNFQKENGVKVDDNLLLRKLYEENIKYKEVLDKIKEYCKNKIEEQKNMTDFSKYYLENYDKAINIQHLSHSGVMLETIKSTTIKRYEDILELLEEIE